MGTILNTCKEARKQIGEVEKKIDEAVFAWKILDDGHKEVAIYYTDKAKEIRDSILELMGKLKTIDMELEKDSKDRPYYNEVYDKCANFLNNTKPKK